jgi:subtilisin family serine protease
MATVKADAARTAFAAIGTGMDANHRHFRSHQTLDVLAPVRHVDFADGKQPLTDVFGHGAHVAGIIAGELNAADVTRSIMYETRLKPSLRHCALPATVRLVAKLILIMPW